MSMVYGGPSDVKLENELSESDDGVIETTNYRKFKNIQFHMIYNTSSRSLMEPNNVDMQVIYDLKPDDLLVVYFDNRDHEIPGVTTDVIREVLKHLHEKYKCKVIALPHSTKILPEDKETFKKRLQEIIKYLDEE